MTFGLRACRGDCALYETCGCADAPARHGDGAPALAGALERLQKEQAVTREGNEMSTGRVAAVGWRDGRPHRVGTQTVRSALALARDATDDGTWHVTAIEVDGETAMAEDEITARVVHGCWHDLPEPEEWARRYETLVAGADRSRCRRCNPVGQMAGSD